MGREKERSDEIDFLSYISIGIEIISND